jgi:cytoskeletal protein CcmA (bactofilin family)
MFKKNESNKELDSINSSTIIGKGTVLEGNIETIGNIRVEGKAIGNIVCKSKIALGESSVVEGNVLAQNAEIAGEVKGVVEVSDMLILKSTAIVHGDIITNKIIIESGATFNGQCKMGAGVKEIKIGERIESGERNQQQRKERTA